MISGIRVFAYRQNGVTDISSASKIESMYRRAEMYGAPVIAFLDSSGTDVSQSLDCLAAYGRIFAAIETAKKSIPTIAVVEGKCVGSAALIPALSDFVVMVENKGSVLLCPPYTTGGIDAKAVSAEGFSAVVADTADFFCSDDESLSLTIRNILSVIPANKSVAPPAGAYDDPERELADNNPEVGAVIRAVADFGGFLEVKPNTANEAVCGFIKINCASVGVAGIRGSLTVAGIEKLTNHIEFCNAFSIPLVTFQNIEENCPFSFMANEHASVLNAAAKLAAAYSRKNAPKISVTTGASFGTPALFGSKPLGADISFLWADGAYVTALSKEAIGKVIPQAATENENFIDMIIPALQTRKYIIAALEFCRRGRGGM
jgi:acetyl-CoA carboxylase carboxyltransferase component